MQRAAIFHKHDVRTTAGIEHMRLSNSERQKYEQTLPCEVSCGHCGMGYKAAGTKTSVPA
ncbi:hypothetical protein [uncultured Desulfosarcina sp.]|uniref:hypothetical protein n=1 Tax=uncultured Desulfosarcina sp. TaxID=218289 RepID=UPI0029C69A9D|nr:hypothetical protein [uncultured Desulfosarcina sp.]